MELDQEIQKASEWINESNKLIDGLSIQHTETNRISVSLLHLSLEHCDGLVALIEKNILGSAIALLRPQLEAYVNGVWIKWCANDKQISSFKKGDTHITFQDRIDAIEELEGHDKKILSTIKDKNWAIYCDFTHGGFLQVMMRNTKDEITYNFPPGYIAIAVNTSAATSLSASIALAKIIDDENLVNNLIKLYKKIYQM